jgi:hypothetical protein
VLVSFVKSRLQLRFVLPTTPRFASPQIFSLLFARTCATPAVFCTFLYSLKLYLPFFQPDPLPLQKNTGGGPSANPTGTRCAGQEVASLFIGLSPLLSHYCKLFFICSKAISSHFNHFCTLAAKHRGGVPLRAVRSLATHRSPLPRFSCIIPPHQRHIGIPTCARGGPSA